MTIRRSPAVRVFTVLLTVVIAIPLTTFALGRTSSEESASVSPDAIHEQALNNKAEIRAQTRALTRLNARCEDATEQTKDLSCRAYLIVQKECLARQSIRQQTGCPTMGELSRIEEVQKALEKGEAVPSVQGADATEQEHTAAQGPTINDLLPSDQRVLRRLIQLQTCSEKLPQVLYLLCTEMVGDNLKPAPVGLLNDLANVQEERHVKTANSLKERIDMTVNARKR